MLTLPGDKIGQARGMDHCKPPVKMNFHISFAEAFRQLQKSEDDFAVLIENGSMRGIIFGPDEIDDQQPHMQDEIYIVMRGTSEFNLQNKVVKTGPGDFLFVPAGAEHRFFNFTSDLLLWVIFYGPEGGERA
ncbi:cupin domain-containing protein [Chitinophaga defluvii]|uniref:Cupin domain-containing protein n=1 Tax=Chitinophaga defluvii TaxID=3163343 RepID=A0ABV2TE59_9BACT